MNGTKRIIQHTHFFKATLKLRDIPCMLNIRKLTKYNRKHNTQPSSVFDNPRI